MMACLLMFAKFCNLYVQLARHVENETGNYPLLSHKKDMQSNVSMTLFGFLQIQTVYMYRIHHGSSKALIEHHICRQDIRQYTVFALYKHLPEHDKIFICFKRVVQLPRPVGFMSCMVYLPIHEWLNFVVNVGKYTSPMDPIIYSNPL